MFISSLQIKNFRSFRDSGEIPFFQNTTFIGPNGSGKSNVLNAIKCFFEDNSIVKLEDFFNKDSGSPISISLTFINLNEEEGSYFGKYVFDGALSVEKRYDSPGKGRYWGKELQNPEFQEIRTLTGANKIKAYNELKKSENYKDLPSARSQQAVDDGLSEWENNHKEKSKLLEAPVQFFGTRNVGGGSLDNFTRFVFIPAIKEASTDGTEIKGGALGELMNILVKEVISQRTELIEFKRSTIEQFRELTKPENFQEFPQLEERLTQRLQALVPQSMVHLTPGKIEEPTFPLPETIIELTEDGFRGSIDRKGHGLQRSFIIAIIQELAIVQAQRDEQIRRSQNSESVEGGPRIANDFRPDLILTIEEPELFQHPIRQRHFSNVLTEFSQKEKSTDRARIQVIICTHSPYFVSVQDFASIRLALKDIKTSPSETVIRVANLESICNTYCSSKEIANPDIQIFFRNLKNIVSNDISEAFFATKVILVEGQDDKYLLEAVLLFKNIDLVAVGIPIIQVNGKNNISRIKLILESLGIDVYFVFDCDKDKKKKIIENTSENKSLMLIGGIPIDELNPFPDEPVVNLSFACFPNRLEDTLQSEFAEFDFQCQRSRIASELKVDEKNPNVYKQLIEEACKKSIFSPTLEKIQKQIISKFNL